MKKVRFETPSKLSMDIIHGHECHFPRPFVEKQILTINSNENESRPVVFTNDPVHRFEYDNSSPYPTTNKTNIDDIQKLENKKVPSSDLDLSMLDCSKPRPSPSINTLYRKEPNRVIGFDSVKKAPSESHKILTSIENISRMHPPNILGRSNDFFLNRENLGKLSFDPLLSTQATRQHLTDENDPHIKKIELSRIGIHTISEKDKNAPKQVDINTDCNCHHCIKTINNHSHNMEHLHRQKPGINYNAHGFVTTSPICSCNCNMQIVQPTCHCNNHQCPPSSPNNAVDKKTWAIETYEKTRISESCEVEKSNKAYKEKREPTVSDLFKIIKLQNEQLKLLQEKVDQFISTHTHEVPENQKAPIQNYVTEQLAIQTMNSEQHKISIGVMTSFEMVRTSTMINKEIVKQCEAQIQCNRSQVSIKEVVSKKQTGNLNFLEGITPVSKNTDKIKVCDKQNCLKLNNDEGCRADNIIEDKTLNELSLYNVQIDNATTPLMSPEQSLYLDIRDYSESESDSDDQSNVGWTYYNRVMTHVNGMLQDSDMPSSASALYRHTKQKYRQVDIDKSNVSVGKRVTFGDNPLGLQQHHITSPTDTSLKMNQLAAKYLKYAPVSHTPVQKATGEMSFATKNYMERHKLLQGQNPSVPQDIPKFLDITALKQQPKFM